MAEIDKAIVGPWKKRCGTCVHFYVVTKRKVYVPSNFPGGFPDDLLPLKLVNSAADIGSTGRWQ